MPADRFVHLHVHSEYSILDGLNGPYSIVRAAGNLGQPAVALTDHGRLSGSVLFWDAIRWYNSSHAERHAFDPDKCHKQPKADDVGCHSAADCLGRERCPKGEAGKVSAETHATLGPIKGILGIETYVAHSGRETRVPRDTGHLVLLAASDEGWQNLRQLASRASLEGFYSKPRIDREILAEHRAGLIALSACLGGHLAKVLRDEGVAAADELIAWYRDTLGPDNYFLELQWHNDQDLGCTCSPDGHPLGVVRDHPCKRQQHDLNRYLIDASRRLGVRCALANDLHYVRREDAALEEIVLALTQGMNLAQLAEAKRAAKDVLSFDTPDFYVKSRAEMEAALNNWYRAAAVHDPDVAAAMKISAASWLDATLEIAARCTITRPYRDGLHFPKFPLPQGHTAESLLAEHVRQKADGRYPNMNEKTRRLISYELQCVQELGFSTYFLITEDFVDEARRRGIEVGLGRGSAPGSVITAVLGITDIDPIFWGLTEDGIGLTRFLNPTVLYRLSIDAFAAPGEPLPPGPDELPALPVDEMEAEVAAALNARASERTELLKAGTPVDAMTGEPVPAARLAREQARWVELRGLLVNEWNQIKRFGAANELAKKTNKLAADAISDRASMVEPLWRWQRFVAGGGKPGTRNEHHSLLARFLGFSSAPLMLLPGDQQGSHASPLLPIYEFKHSRKTMPDIDIDFEPGHDGREAVMRYVTDKYGADHVCQIATFGSMLAKSAIKDVARAKGLTPEEANELTLLIPAKFAAQKDDETDDEETPGVSLKEMITNDHPSVVEGSRDLRARMAADPRVDEVVRTAARLEGMKRSVGTHACGVLITPEPVSNYVSVERVAKGVGTQAVHDGPTLTDQLGLLKVDFLGLKNLAVNKLAVALISARRGETVNWRKPPIDDQAALRLMAQGRTEGIFQFSKKMGTSVARQMKPRRTSDLMVATALGRPGPSQYIPTYVEQRAAGKVVYGDPVFERLAGPILAETYGVLVYQEQVMRMAIAVADFTLPESDGLRKATAKKDKALLASWRDKFVEGAVRKGVNRGFIEHYWDQTLTPFAAYSFNKSHSTAYGFMAYTQAYLKAHYMPEFMAALVSVDQHEGKKSPTEAPPLVKDLLEAQRLELQLRPVDINSSGMAFAIEDIEPEPGGVRDLNRAALRTSLACLKGVGTKPVELIVAERTAHGPFAGFGDFMARLVEREKEKDPETGKTIPNAINKSVVIALIKVGAFDAFDDRAALLRRVEAYFGTVSVKKRAEIDWTPAAQRPALPPRDYLDWEMELLGFYVSAHPADSIPADAIEQAVAAAQEREARAARQSGKTARDVERATTADALAFERLRDSDVHVVAGVLTAVSFKPTRSGKERYVGKLEDQFGSCDFVYWAPREGDERLVKDAWNEFKANFAQLIGEGIVLVGGFTYHEQWQNPGGISVDAWQKIEIPRLEIAAVMPAASKAVKVDPASYAPASPDDVAAGLELLFPAQEPKAA